MSMSMSVQHAGNGKEKKLKKKTQTYKLAKNLITSTVNFIKQKLGRMNENSRP